MNRAEKRYLMEDVRESQRLAAKVNPSEYVQEYLEAYVKAKKSKRKIRFLDVGCGAGNVTAQVAKMFPEIAVVGVDISRKRFQKEKEKSTHLKNLTFVEMDAENLQFYTEKFDFVHCRFLLEYLRSPDETIKSFAGLLSKGGILILQDLDGQLVSNYPVAKAFQQKIDKVIVSLKAKGFDPWVGRKLYSHVMKSGLQVIDVRLEAYHLFPGRIDSWNLGLWKQKLKIAEPIIAAALKTRASAKLFVKQYIEYLKDKHTLSFSTVFTVTALNAR